MFRRRAKIRERLPEFVDKFRQKGAVNSDNAVTLEELGLPPQFKELLKRRLGRLGVFLEVNGKYYMSEERLKEVKEKLASRRRFRRF